MTAAFVATIVATPVAAVGIGAVYQTQYRLAKGLRPLAVIVHFVAVSTIICTYALLCWEQYRSTGWQYPGWATFAAGSALFWYSVRCHPTCLVPDEGTGVVSAGPYRFVRHPIYAGGLLGALGLVGVAPSGEMVAAWVVLAASIGGLAAVEEREITTRLGSGYETYRRRTRLLIPGVL